MDSQSPCVYGERLDEKGDFNTLKRSKSAPEFEKKFIKLLNNSAFDKTMENLRKHLQLASQPT